jgi:hypothetical protein
MEPTTPQNYDLSRILDASHENKWVAIAPDYTHMIAAAESLRELLRLVPEPTAVIWKVLPHDVSFAP